MKIVGWNSGVNGFNPTQMDNIAVLRVLEILDDGTNKKRGSSGRATFLPRFEGFRRVTGRPQPPKINDLRDWTPPEIRPYVFKSHRPPHLKSPQVWGLFSFWGICSAHLSEM